MTKTFTLAALVAGSLLAGNALQAQDTPKNNSSTAQGDHGIRGRQSLDQIAKDLNLTDDQKTKFKAAQDDLRTKLRGLRDDSSLSQEDRRNKAKEIQKDYQAKIKEILTPDQFEKWQKHQHTRPGAKPTTGADK